MFFETLPDYEVNAVPSRLCRLQIREVGTGLPCLSLTNIEDLVVFNKSDGQKTPFYDMAYVTVPNVCPRSIANDEKSTQFVANFVFEHPPHENSSAGKKKVV